MVTVAGKITGKTLDLLATEKRNTLQIVLVTTGVGAQGLEGLQEVAQVADHAPQIAACIVKLLEDDADWALASSAGAQCAAQRFSRASLSAEIERVTHDGGER